MNMIRLVLTQYRLMNSQVEMELANGEKLLWNGKIGANQWVATHPFNPYLTATRLEGLPYKIYIC